MSEQINRPHRKGKEKKKPDKTSQNPKAHTFTNAGRLQRQTARSAEIKEKRLHVPLVDRLPEEAPPLIVAVAGPPEVGKTTLIKSLIRRYTKQTLSSPTGPLTVVTSKRRRLTFIECPSDSLAAMIDIAKIVDIVLLLIDGKYGFEMETMEFLNILSASGMPGNVFGILTKLDLFKKQDTLRAQKKRLKQRLWSELYHGAKLFYLSGIVNGRYPDREIHNISRFLAVMKSPRPLIWRNSHPYCLADRFLDITPPTEVESNPKCDRTVALYGYLRGTNFPAEGARVHVPGLGDLTVANIEALRDPCPTPFIEQAIQKATGKAPRKRLGEKHKVLFAPMSDVGGVLVDKDAVYIDVKTSTFVKDAAVQERGLGEQMMIGLQGERKLLGTGGSEMRLFGDSGPLHMDGLIENGHEYGKARRPATTSDANGDYDDGESEDHGLSDDADGLSVSTTDEDYQSMLNRNADPSVDDPTVSEGRLVNGDGETNNLAFADSDSDIGSLSSVDENAYQSDEDDLSESGSRDEVDGQARWGAVSTADAETTFGPRYLKRAADLVRLMYDTSLSSLEAIKKWSGPAVAPHSQTVEEQTEDEFFQKRKTEELDSTLEERLLPVYDYKVLAEKFSDPERVESLRSRFTHLRYGRDASGDSESDDAFGNLSDDEGDGQFEDLEAPLKEADPSVNEGETDLAAEREKNARRKEELKLRFEEEDKEGFANDKTNGRSQGVANHDQDFGEDEWYDAQKAKMQSQLAINRSEFEGMDEKSRIRTEGYRAGTYARIVLSHVPYEFSANFSPRNPIVVGGLAPTEDRFGYVQVRIKRHRWHKRILKTNDPIIFSLGWRRFQTLPIYSIHENRLRHRMLKYTPEHMHCTGSFYGPLIAPNTSFCCVQSFSNKTAGFRVAATGTVLSVEENVEIVKKLKLKGYPHKIYKNTAIIKDMFGSELEVMKFKAANLRTVSGVRGMIKGRAGNKYPTGYIRAGFEDKILMSDIVFLSTWRQIKPREFYLPVTNLLMSQQEADADEEAGWSGMRLTGEVRRDKGMATPKLADSAYRTIVRPDRHFNPLKVPKKLAADLPFKSQIAQMKPQRTQTYLQKRAVVLGGEEKRARDLVQKLSALRNEKVALRRVAQEKRREPHRQLMADNLQKKADRERREKDEYWRREGKKRKHQNADESGAKRKKSRA